MTQQNPTESHTTPSPGRQPGGTPHDLPIQQNPTESNTLEDLAVATLRQLLANEKAQPELRLRAAQAILRTTTRPAGRSTAYTRSIAQFDQLCIDLAPHQALQRLKQTR